MKIKLLSQDIINQIAAGEVIERPSSVIKELIENSIDAKATEIIVSIIDAGKSFISVSDNGTGMDVDSLKMCVLSHATSKLNYDNLFDIHTFGFRGEALPSIASISRISISSAQQSSDGWCLQLEGSQNVNLFPINKNIGSTVEVRDLFFATPARLKFLKSDSYEADNCFAVFNRIALSHKNITFKFIENNKEKAYYQKKDNLKDRIQDIFGESFIKNIFEIDVQKDSLKLYGYIGVPTFNKSSMSNQYFFVNNRFVKDKIFASALRSTYSSLTPNGRYPVAILFLNMPHNEVDVNAHPAKIEIRFKEAEKIRMFITSELKKSLSSFGSSFPTTELTDSFYIREKTSVINNDHEINKDFICKQNSFTTQNVIASHEENYESKMHHNKIYEDHLNAILPTEKEYNYQNSIKESINLSDDSTDIINLGDASFQINNTYIVAKCVDGLVIVDQHAAAERLMLEALKNNLKLDSQDLLIPDVCNFSESEVELLKENDDLIKKLGIYIDFMSKDIISINSLPALLETSDAKSVVMDIIDELSMFGDIYSIEEKIHSILSSISCHSSIRAGKKLSINEMNYLLRRMEKTTNIAQCCHGRPSYIKIYIKDLNKFFERS